MQGVGQEWQGLEGGTAGNTLLPTAMQDNGQESRKTLVCVCVCVCVCV